MSDPDNYNIFAPKNALRRTPPTNNKPPSRGPTPLPSTPQVSSPKDMHMLSRDVSPLIEPLRPMTSPLRNLDSDDIDGPQTQPTPTTTSRHLHVSITPRASTVEPVTPSFSRIASSVPNTSVRRRLTTPHAIRGYSNRPTPHKNQGKRRNSRFAAEDDDIFQALKQFSKITAPKSKPFIPTPKAITPKAVSERRRTLEGIRLNRDLNAVSSDEEVDPIRPPRLSNVSLRLIGKRLTIRDNHEAEEDDDVEISPPPQLSTPLRDSGDDDDLKSGGIETPRFEVARRAEITNEISSPPPPRPDDDMEPVFIGSDFDDDDDEDDDDGPPPFQPDDNIGLRTTARPNATGKRRSRKELPLSVHGIPYPSLSTKVIKSIIARTSKQKISKEALAMIASASEAYFENLGEDLGSFAKHAKRKTVEEGDVLQVLRRHRLLNDKTTVFSLANQYLPRELLQDIKIQVPQKNLPKQRRRRGVDDSMADEMIEEE